MYFLSSNNLTRSRWYWTKKIVKCVLKYILCKGELLVGKLLIFNALEMSFRKLNIQRNNNCPVCGDKPTITKLIDYEQFCGVNNPR